MLSEPKDSYCKTKRTFMKSEVWPERDEPFRLQTSGQQEPVELFLVKKSVNQTLQVEVFINLIIS